MPKYEIPFNNDPPFLSFLSPARFRLWSDVLQSAVKNYRISWGLGDLGKQREQAWTEGVLRSAWSPDDQTQWRALVDDGLMDADFVNNSQVQVSSYKLLLSL